MDRARRWTWPAFCAGAIALFLTPARLTEPLKLSVLSLYLPVRAAADGLQTLAGWSLDLDTPAPREQALRTENDLLRASLIRAEGESARLRRMLSGAADLRRAALAVQPRLIAAPVLFQRDASDWRNSFVLARGKLDGIAEGAPVVSGAVLVGRVRAVSAYTAEVQSITDPEFETGCRIVPAAGVAPPSPATVPAEGAASVPGVPANPPAPAASVPPSANDLQAGEGVLFGKEGGTECGVKWIDRNARIQPGDWVMASGGGDGDLFDGLLIGRVLRFGTMETGFYYRIDVEPAVRTERLRDVFVLQAAPQAASRPQKKRGK